MKLKANLKVKQTLNTDKKGDKTKKSK